MWEKAEQYNAHKGKGSIKVKVPKSLINEEEVKDQKKEIRIL